VAAPRIPLSWLLAILAAVGGLAWLVHCSGPPRVDAPPGITAEQLQALPADRMVSAALDHLRWRLAVVEPERVARWRTMDEPARTLLAISAAESDAGPSAQGPFHGFQALCADPSPLAPTLDELATAYTVIGAVRVAEAVRAAKPLAAAEVTDPGRWAACDRAFLQALQADRSRDRQRAYVRAHAEEIAAQGSP
jgi:hypothetical protein